ncbi:hypothetical protein DERP_011582 [Dermatophagoides pteronyssinus]|uniref:Uncharacterized protein n=1 Tax=Dermatophagoides pteronyssinus TaxID=6956 RepID=A0ABQ8JWC3_DERPT|nr:hypothetical protein DERP_011582 [Dermatophagoides pteronyssinus]
MIVLTDYQNGVLPVNFLLEKKEKFLMLKLKNQLAKIYQKFKFSTKKRYTEKIHIISLIALHFRLNFSVSKVVLKTGI